MSNNKLYDHLGFTDEVLTYSKDISTEYPDYAELVEIGADAVYFSNSRPVVFFLDVDAFNDVALRNIAKVQLKAWNYSGVYFLIVIGPNEIRVYNCHAIPCLKRCPTGQDLEESELIHASDESEDMELLTRLFSKSSLDLGKVWIEQDRLRRKIELKDRLDAFLVKSMDTAKQKLHEMGLRAEYTHALLVRSLFILFLEDKGAAESAGLYRQIKEDSKSYFDILKEKDATYNLFAKLNAHFEGSISKVMDGESEAVTKEHLHIIYQCFYDGDFSGNPNLFNERLFDFKIIRVELLSEIYESFLVMQKQERGQYYTPSSLVNLMVEDNVPVEGTPDSFKILDPTCGSGIFLVQCFRRLIKIWKERHIGQKIEFEDLRTILVDNIYGIEIDETAIKVAALSLYLALIEELDPKTLWIETSYKLPPLIKFPGDEEKVQGYNLLLSDMIGGVTGDDLPKMDLVIGNPPFGNKNLSNEEKRYVGHHEFANEKVLAFMHKAVEFCPSGRIAFVFNTKVLTCTNGKYAKFRDWLFCGNYVESVYNLSVYRQSPSSFGGKLFSSAIAPVSVIYYSPMPPSSPSSTITYWAPRTYLKQNVIDGLIKNADELRYIPRDRSIVTNSSIWKIAQWGSFADYMFLDRLKRYETLDTFMGCTDGWVSGKGINKDSNNPDFVPTIIFPTRAIMRYYSDASKGQRNLEKYRMPKETLFNRPYLAIVEGLHKRDIACSMMEANVFCKTGASVINADSMDDKYFLMGYLNSRLVKYILFMTSSSWGIERERIMLNEITSLPSPFGKASEDIKGQVVTLVKEIVDLKRNLLEDQIKIDDKEKAINVLFYKAFGISDRERILIDDALDYSLDLFFEGVHSVATRPVDDKMMRAYTSMLKEELDFFQESFNLSVERGPESMSIPYLSVIVVFGDCPSTDVRESVICPNMTQIFDKMTSSTSGNVFKYYDGDTIWIFKPNQKRYWLQSQAIIDASSIITDIANMGG